MTLWIISGACRSLGKTYLTARLGEILPGAVKAKIGHHPPQPGRPENYFTRLEDFFAFLEALPGDCRHCIAESNELALRGEGDIRIYLHASARDNRARADAEALRARADILVLPETQPEQEAWRAQLARVVDDPEQIRKICDALEDQWRFLRGADAR